MIAVSAPNAPIEDQLADLLAEHAAAKRERITSTTMLQSDLSMDGDDADEFMEAYAKRFSVDMSEFRFLDHFEWEGVDPFRPVILFILRLFSPRLRTRLRAARARESEITVAHLTSCAQTGRWGSPNPPLPFHRRPPFWVPSWFRLVALVLGSIGTLAILGLLILGPLLFALYVLATPTVEMKTWMLVDYGVWTAGSALLVWVYTRSIRGWFMDKTDVIG